MARPIHWKQSDTSEELKAAYIATHEDIHKRRIWAIWQMKTGKAGQQVAQDLALEPRTVYKWLSQYQQGGLSGLLPKKRSGRHPKKILTKEELQQEIRSGKYYSLKRIRQVLKDKYGAEYTISGTWALLERNDITWKVGRRRHSLADQTAQEAFKKTV